MPLFFCCKPSRAAAAPEAEAGNVHENNGGEEREGKIDYLKTPESFTMQRIAAGMHIRNENKILKDKNQSAVEIAVTSQGLFLGDTSRPPRTLLEGSARRVARNLAADLEAQKNEAKTSHFGMCKAFTDAYVKALESCDGKWASKAEVSNLFHKNAKLIAQDRQTYHGSAAIIRRLNTGVGQLCKMAGRQENEEEGHETQKDASQSILISDPEEKCPGVWCTTYTVRWGVRKLRFQDEFSFEEDKIKKLRRSRI